MEDPTTIALNLTFFGTLAVALVMFFGLFLVFVATLVIAGLGRLVAVTVMAVGRGLFRTGRPTNRRNRPAGPPGPDPRGHPSCPAAEGCQTGKGCQPAKAAKPARPAKPAKKEPALSRTGLPPSRRPMPAPPPGPRRRLPRPSRFPSANCPAPRLRHRTWRQWRRSWSQPRTGTASSARSRRPSRNPRCPPRSPCWTPARWSPFTAVRRCPEAPGQAPERTTVQAPKQATAQAAGPGAQSRLRPYPRQSSRLG